MKAGRWQRVEELFAGAAGVPEGQRRRWLEGQEADRELVREVVSLLAAEEGGSDRLEAALGAGLAALEEVSRPGEEGSLEGAGVPLERALPSAPRGYRILSRIGFGGTAAVYRAQDPTGRPVALKLLRPELADGFVSRRFEAERRTLARLRSPVIARLLDAGTTPEGLPFVATELVDGVSIDAYCRGKDLETALELFQAVCHAVQHAHRNLIIHRDLKPANILVSGDGAVKLLDFGLAAVLGAGPASAVEPTATAQRMLTPSCASPEQIRGEPLTTATDIYSLGVLLYRLSTGRHPQEAWQTSAGELARAILEEDPPAPSAAVVAGRRHRLPKDLDSVVLKALAKEPERRYGSAEQLAEDVRRSRVGLPVTARPPTLGYRAAKFLRRHRWGTAAAAVLLVSLGAFAVLSNLQQRRTALAQERAETSLAMLVDLLGSADPRRSAGEALTARDLLDRTLERIPRELAGQPEVEATLLDAVGTLYLSLGTPDRAEPALRRALELRRRYLGPFHGETARSLQHLARLREAQGDYGGAEELYRRALEAARPSLGKEHPETAAMLNGLADALHGQGEYGAAETYYLQALDLRREVVGEGSPAAAETLNHLGLLYHERGDLDAAEANYRQALEIRRSSLGDGHPDTVQSLGNLAALERSRGRLERAEELFRQVLAGTQEIFGEHHPELTAILQNLALLLIDRGEPEEAEELLRREEAVYRLHSMEDHPTRGTNLYHLGLARKNRGDGAGAEAYFRAALDHYARSLPPEHPWQSFPRIALGQALVAAGRADEAEELLRRGLELRRETLEPGHWRRAEAETYLGACLVELGRPEEAQPLLRHGLEVLEATFGHRHRRSVYAREYLSRAAAEGAPAVLHEAAAPSSVR